MQLSFRTSPPSNYITPSGEEMREAANAVGLKSFSRDLVADLCNLAADGTVNPPSHYQDQVRRTVEETLPTPSQYGWYLSNKQYTKERHEAIADATRKAMQYHQNVVDFLGSIDLAKFPGTSPLEQAMSLLKLLSKQNGGSGGGEGGEPLPIFMDKQPEETAENLNSLMDQIDSLSSDELDMIDPNGENHEVESKDGNRTSQKDLNRLKVAEDLTDPDKKRLMLEVSRKLDKFAKLQARKQVKLEEDPAGEEVRQRSIRHLGELSKVSPSAWATRQQSPTYFLYQAVTGALPVRERVTRMERKQAIYILVDGSGSFSGRKHFKATGVVMNRLKAVLTGDAVVWVSVFDTDLSKAVCANTPEEARKLIKEFSERNFSGGGTDIAGAVKAAHQDIEKRIKKGEALYRPEVVVLTDDDTSVSSLKISEIPGTRVHGFAVESKNPSLVALAKATGGVGIEQF
jgi:uncharacterized protein with von Willebrand factor type A (vWA) domain